MDPKLKHAIDAGAALTAGGAVLGLLPQIAAGFAIVWYAIQMYDRFFKKKK